jgi:hypothetical protein
LDYFSKLKRGGVPRHEDIDRRSRRGRGAKTAFVEIGFFGGTANRLRMIRIAYSIKKALVGFIFNGHVLSVFALKCFSAFNPLIWRTI